MAIYRTRGLYALNQPSRYVGQSEDFRDWLHTAPEEDVALCERASEFEEHFADMLFDSSVIDNADECTEDGESFDFQPEELHDFTLSWVRFSVAWIMEHMERLSMVTTHLYKFGLPRRPATPTV